MSAAFASPPTASSAPTRFGCDANEEWLYVVESNARRISRLRVQPDGPLTDREVYGPARLQGIPDGFAFDAIGNLWMTYVISDRIAVLTPEGEEQIVFDDGDAAKVRAFDQHFFAGTVTPEVMMGCGGTRGAVDCQPDLRRPGPANPLYRQPARHDHPLRACTGAGLPMVHWHERY